MHTRTHHRIAICLTALVVLGVGFAFTPHARAATTIVKCSGVLPTGVTYGNVGETWIRLQVAIPSITYDCTDSTGMTAPYIADMSTYVAGLYKYFVGIIGVLAAVMVFYGGVKWLTAAGNASRVKDAKEVIFSALIAIVISFGSYLLLYTINPNLVNLRPLVLNVLKANQQSYATCQTQKTCQGGEKQGTVCVTDSVCPGSVCSYGVDLSTSDPPTQDPFPTCGSTYAYTQKTTSPTCLGTVCKDPNSSLSNGTTALRCMSVKNNLNGPTAGDAGCFQTSGICGGVSRGDASSATCAKYSQAGLGRCAFYDATNQLAAVNHCEWHPMLKCDEGYARIGCGAITSNNISCTSRQVFEDPLFIARYPLGVVAYCNSTAAEEVDFTDPSSDGKGIRGIGCAKTYCQDGTKIGQPCFTSAGCSDATSPIHTCAPNAVPVKEDLQCVTK